MLKPVHALLFLSLTLLPACNDDNKTVAGDTSSIVTTRPATTKTPIQATPTSPDANVPVVAPEEPESGVIAKDALNKITLAANLTKTEQKRMQADLHYLHVSSVRSNDEFVTKVLGIPEANNQSLTAWLNDRLQYIVGKSKPLDALLVDSGERVAYENPEILPDVVLDLLPGLKGAFSQISSDEERGTTIATNVGSLGYLFGKISKTGTQAIDIPGVGHVVMRSPRTGVIQAAKGYSISLLDFYGIRGSDPNSEGNKINRLSTLFHEARHSDGHGKSLSFMHTKCPEGHDLAGMSACDNNLNGPYLVGATTTAIFLQTCTTCSTPEKEALRLAAIDSAGRISVADENAPGAYWDATPEGRR